MPFAVAASELFTAETVNWSVSPWAWLRSDAIAATSELATHTTGAARAPGCALERSRAIAATVNSSPPRPSFRGARLAPVAQGMSGIAR